MNTATNLRRLNPSATVTGKLGDDMFGDFVVAELGRHGIGTSLIKRNTTLPTSTTVILNVHGEDRR